MEKLRVESRESIDNERRESRAARDELTATVQALRAYYEGQRLGSERAKLASSSAALGGGVVGEDKAGGSKQQQDRPTLLRGTGKGGK